ncbi:MAG: hypothetical protein HQL77_12865 [Magnetococcales bacterium]|nr:hypothetical protein [Magnetococcales bacterium]
MFLRGYRLLFGDYSGLAMAQLLIHDLSCFLFYAALVRFGFPVSAAFFATVPIVIADNYFAVVMTDSLGASIGLIIIALLLRISTNPSGTSFLTWFALTFFTTLSYHVRPANLPFICIVPLLGVLIPLMRNSHQRLPTGWRNALKMGTVYSVATVVPFLAFCLIRLVLVGHFGLVSFGGINVIAVTAPMIKPETFSLLSADTRPLAEAIYKEKNKIIQDKEISDSYIYIHNFRMHDKRITEALYQKYGAWVSEPAAHVLYGEDSVKINAMFTKLSHELIRIYPKEYLRWIISGFYNSFQTMNKEFFPAGYVFPILVLTILIRFVAGPITLKTAPYLEFDYHFKILTIISLITYAALTLLFVLVEPPLTRYVYPTILFVLPLLAFFIWRIGIITLTVPAHPATHEQAHDQNNKGPIS